MTLRKKLLFSLIPVCILIIITEAYFRISYFYFHDKDIFYLTTPFHSQEKNTASADAYHINVPVTKDHSPDVDSIYPGNDGKEPLKFWKDRNGWFFVSRPGEYFLPAYVKRSIDKLTAFKSLLLDSTGKRKYLIFCIGGSTTVGMHAHADSTYPAILQQQLGENYHVVNCGVSAYMSNNYLNLLREGLLVHNPDLVIIYSGYNDLNYFTNISFERSRKFSGKIHRALYYKYMTYTISLEKYSKWKMNDQIPFVKDRSLALFKTNQIAIVEMLDRTDARLLYVKQELRRADKMVIKEKHAYASDHLQKLSLNEGVYYLDLSHQFDSSLYEGHKVFSDILHLTVYGNQLLGTEISKFIKDDIN